MLEFRFAVLTLLVGVVYLPGLSSGATQPRWWVLALGVLFLSWNYPWREQRTGVLVVLPLWAWSALGMFWTLAPWDTLEGLCAVVLLGIVLLMATKTNDLSWCWEAAALACWLQLPIIILQTFDYAPVWSAVTKTPVGLLLSKNMLAEFALVAGVGVLFTRYYFLALGPALCIAALWHFNSPWEVLFGLATVGVVVVLRYFSWKFVAPALALFAVVIAIGLHYHQGSYSERVYIWEHVAYWSALYPFGWGLNSFADAVPGTEYAHNDFLQIFFELGIPGVLLTGFILARAFAAPGKLGEKCALAAVLACSCLWWPLRCPATAFVVAVAAGNLWGSYPSVSLLGRYRRKNSTRSLRYDYEDFSPDTVRAARAGCEVLPIRPQYPLVGGEISEHI